jgi:hypothetical protein
MHGQQNIKLKLRGVYNRDCVYWAVGAEYLKCYINLRF